MRVVLRTLASSSTRLTSRKVREIGLKLGVPDALRLRHPFPGPGLAIRITGAIDAAQLRIARDADQIFIREIIAAGLYSKMSQALACLLGGVKAVAVMGDKR